MCGGLETNALILKRPPTTGALGAIACGAGRQAWRHGHSTRACGQFTCYYIAITTVKESKETAVKPYVRVFRAVSLVFEPILTSF